MATSDGESCSAEDRALAKFEDEPWGDAEEGSPWSALEEWIERTQRRLVARYQEAFRAGFRAGQEAGPQLGVELARIRDRLNALELWHQQSEAAGQPFPLGTKYEHLAQRVAELESTSVSRLEHVADLERIDKRFANVDANHSSNCRRIEALEESDAPRALHQRIDNLTAGLNERLDKLEQHPERLGSSEKHFDRRVEQVGTHSGENRSRIEALEKRTEAQTVWLSAIEAKLRLLEPIG